MSLAITMNTADVALSDAERRHITGQLRALERRLAHHPDPSVSLVFTPHPTRRQIEVALRVQLGPLGGHLISHQAAETADHAVRAAVEDVERQLERRLATQRGESTYGVPSRREPAQLRPHPPSRLGARTDAEAEGEEP